MIKKISYLIITAAILVTGIIAFRKLSYWERSVRIFSNNNSEQSFEGRRGRDGEGRLSFQIAEGQGRSAGREEYEQREGFERPDLRQLPDSMRTRSEGEGRGQIVRDRNIPDSLRQQFRRNEGEPFEREGIGGGMRGHGGGGRGEFQVGKKISLGNVGWFMAVFAAFAVIIIYIDKAYCFIRRKNCNNQQ